MIDSQIIQPSKAESAKEPRPFDTSALFRDLRASPELGFPQTLSEEVVSAGQSIRWPQSQP